MVATGSSQPWPHCVWSPGIARKQIAKTLSKHDYILTKNVTSNIEKIYPLCLAFDRWRRWFDSSFFLSGGLQNKRLGGRAVGRAGVARAVSFRLSPCCQVPKAVVTALGKHSIQVDTGNLTPATFRYLVDLRCPMHLPVAACKHLIHIFSEEHGEERGALDFFTTLPCCNLVSLDLQLCSGIHASAWQKVRNAKWLNLKKANFNKCLAERNGWGFSCFIAACIRKLFEFGSGEICEVVVGVGVDRDRFKMECTWTCPGLVPFPTSFQIDSSNTAGVSTLTRKVQMEPQICFKPWVSRRCWKSWIFNCVITSPQQHGKKSVMPSGSTWRRQISGSAS